MPVGAESFEGGDNQFRLILWKRLSTWLLGWRLFNESWNEYRFTSDSVFKPTTRIGPSKRCWSLSRWSPLRLNGITFVVSTNPLCESVKCIAFGEDRRETDDPSATSILPA
ncbi:hypothetical protein [Rhodopirellula europaea]|uniref:hypothetical protein n=1 Tax=Rhodopirellula europaea TaxID=1263866 RepID=UPI003D2B06F8